ncbi:Protein DMR6-LIKE OXYGENASE 1 [Bienertia sinuspersici]
MSPAISLRSDKRMKDNQSENQYQKGVKHLCENGIKKVPTKYILPISDRPNTGKPLFEETNIKLPVIDFAELQGPNRSQVLQALTNACEQYGFFQVVNHGIPTDAISSVTDVCKSFFELPFEERQKHMSTDMKAPVRYGTSFIQNKDAIYCWRDFLKLVCHPKPDDVHSDWPSLPQNLRKQVAAYSKETRNLFMLLMGAILESLGLGSAEMDIAKENNILEEFQEGSQMIVTNCYPPCPEPELTLGMPPHSDYGFLTLLLQDEVKGLQIQFQEKWLTVEPIPNAFVVNIGDHLEIFSNGRYRSVLHRVLVNQEKTRVTVASLHSLPFERVIQPSPKLISKTNPRRYKDTDFAAFLEYISACEPKKKAFLESRRLS